MNRNPADIGGEAAGPIDTVDHGMKFWEKQANALRNTPDVVCVLSGGAAGAVAPRLSIPFQLHENLVLEGLYRVSQDLPLN